MFKKAVIIGIDAYPGAARLGGCVNDARELAQLISANGDASPNCEVELHTDVPTKARVNALIRQAFSGDSNTAILYFSGHGFVNELGGYLVTPDATALDEGIPMDNILQLANASACRNRIIILDCCHSGAIGKPRFTEGSVTPVGEGVVVLTASRSNEASMEIGGHGVFTYLLLDALRGGAADLSGHITPAGIYSYIDQALGEFEQRPVFKANISRFVSLRETTPQVSKTILRKIIHHFPSPGWDFPLDPSFEDSNTPDRSARPVPPFSLPENVARLKELQQLQSVGLVVPVGASFLYFAAMESKACRLTDLGRHYWRLAKQQRIY